MAKEKYEYYKSKISSGENYLDVIKQARKDFELVTDFSYDLPYEEDAIPFNLDREYLIFLIESKKYEEAKSFIENMKKTYKGPDYWNFIETFEYHLHAALLAEKNIQSAIEIAKKEFNQHTITIVSIVVGVITILGTANQVFTVNNFQEGMNTFFSITIAIIAIIIITYWMANNSNRK